MKLVTAQVKMFKSIEDSGVVSIEEGATVLVGQNESGKTTFLQALHKARPVQKDVVFDVTEDYPRRHLNQYEKRHKDSPAEVVVLTCELTDAEVRQINSDLKFELLESLTFSVKHKYTGASTVVFDTPEEFYVEHLLSSETLSGEIINATKECKSLRSLADKIEQVEESRNAQDTAFLEKIQSKFDFSNWDNVLQFYIWTKHLDKQRPKFVYFDDYSLLPGKINLPQLQTRVKAQAITKKALENSDKTALGLMSVADMDLDSLISPRGYEENKAKMEGISISITDKVFNFWKQNTQLEVEFDVRDDANDAPPYDNGNNLYIRIKNQRHKVTVPFSQRSKGFIWFFSFIVWFDSIQEQVDTNDDLILLLDEPGLSLHAMAQADFLRYIDELAQNHQLIYTTHSPFMIHSDRLHIARAVQDFDEGGTKITSDISRSDSSTLFPLQAALGYTIAQNLFIGERNL